jgi:hypothetical protein
MVLRAVNEAAHAHVVEQLEGRVLLSVVRFGAEANLGVGTSPESVLATDVNGDGKIDLVTANYNPYLTGTVSVLLGNGNGTFKPEQEFPVGAGPRSVVAGDFNSDHKIDLAVADSADGTVAILAGNGDGTFGSPSFISVGSGPQFLAVTDVNLDQKPDLFVTNLGLTTITELLGNGNGTFLKSQVTMGSTLQAGPIVASDVTNDNRPDLIVAIPNKSAVGVLVNVGNSQFAAPLTFDAGINPNEIGLGDLNGDGLTDLVIPNQSAGANYVSVLQGNGNGTFRARQTYYTGDTSPSSVAVADFNGDGKPDLAVADYNFSDVAILLNDGGGGFVTPQKFSVSSHPSRVVAADLDGDGKPDLAVAQTYVNTVGTKLNTSQPFVVSINRKQPTSATTSVQIVNFTVTFNTAVTGVDSGDFAAQGFGVASGAVSVTPVSGSVYTVTVQGVAGNGRLGLNLVNNGSIHDSTGQALQSTGPSFTPQQTISTGTQYSDTTVVKDVNGDGKTDVITCSGNSTIGSVLLGNGNGTFQAARTFADGAHAYRCAVADVNGDGKQDLIITNNYGYTGRVSVLLGNGDGTFNARQTFNPIDGPTGVAVGDINGDGRADLVLTNEYQDSTVNNYGETIYYPAGRPVYMLGNGNGTFGPPIRVPFSGTLPYQGAPVVADLNGDVKLDLVLCKAGTLNAAIADVLLGNGNGTFQAERTFAFPGAGAQEIVGADINGDGRTDLMTTGSPTILLGNGNGTFHAGPTPRLTGYGPVVIADVNGDGKLDIIDRTAYGFAVELGGGSGGFFTPGPSFVTGSAPDTLSVGDFNGDGKPDVLATYHAASLNGSMCLLLGGTAGVVDGQPYTIVPPIDSVVGTSGVDAMTLTRDVDGVDIDMTLNSLTTQFPVNDSKGLTFVGNGGNDVITLNYANGNPLPNLMHLNGTFTINGLSGANPLATTQFEIAQSTVYFSYSAASPATVIAAALKLGYNGGAWNGSGGGVITSNAAAGGAPGVFGVGYADSVDGVVSGQPANTVEVRYTMMGDLNLDRVVTSTDAIVLARNYLIAGRSSWDQGNFNFDTTINLSDAQILQKNYNAVATGSVTSGVNTGRTVTTPIVQSPIIGQGSGPSGSDAGGTDLTTTKKYHKKRHH